MPIIIPKSIPAYNKLTDENIFVMHDKRAITQNIRPIEILILNLMPTKIDTENQILRVLSNSPLQVHLTLISTKTYQPTHIDQSHLSKYYKTFDEIKHKRFDGLIITGAPVEHLDYEDVKYWDELKEIFEFTKTNVTSTIYICWGALAGLSYHYDIPKIVNDEKLFGVFKQENKAPHDPLLRGLDDYFKVPFSTYATPSESDLLNHKDLNVLAYSSESGASIIASKDLKHVFITGHLEYDRDTLKKEYERDLDKGITVNKPSYYFNDLDHVDYRWNSTAFLIFTNWLNYYVYQETPYQIKNESLNIGLLGFGTVGKNVFDLIDRDQRHNIVKVLERSDEKNNLGVLHTSDIDEILNDASIDVVIELIGGYEVAYDYIKRALRAKKHVVTANKHVISEHLLELIQIADEHDVEILYGASVGGGIPLIKNIFDYIKSNEINEYQAIINGTTNYILTKIFIENKSFDEALKEAQDNGFAEKIPDADIKAHDATRKISILSSIALGEHIKPESCLRVGIDHLTEEIIEAIKQSEYTLKLVSSLQVQNGIASIGTYPALIKHTHKLNGFSYENNVLLINDHTKQPLLLSGKGAGGFPTASAVVGNVEDVVQNIKYVIDKKDTNHQVVSPFDIEQTYATIENGKLIERKGIISKEVKDGCFVAIILD